MLIWTRRTEVPGGVPLLSQVQNQLILSLKLWITYPTMFDVAQYENLEKSGGSWFGCKIY